MPPSNGAITVSDRLHPGTWLMMRSTDAGVCMIFSRQVNIAAVYGDHVLDKSALYAVPIHSTDRLLHMSIHAGLGSVKRTYTDSLPTIPAGFRPIPSASFILSLYRTPALPAQSSAPRRQEVISSPRGSS